MKNCELIKRLETLNPLSDVYFEVKGSWIPVDSLMTKEFGDDGSIILKQDKEKENG